MLIAIQKGLSLVDVPGQTVLVFTADQQLFKVTTDIPFHTPSYFEKGYTAVGWHTHANDLYIFRLYPSSLIRTSRHSN